MNRYSLVKIKEDNSLAILTNPSKEYYNQFANNYVKTLNVVLKKDGTRIALGDEDIELVEEFNDDRAEEPKK